MRRRTPEGLKNVRQYGMIGQLYHCLMKRELFDEQTAFPAAA